MRRLSPDVTWQMSNTKIPTGLTSALSRKCLSGHVYS